MSPGSRVTLAFLRGQTLSGTLDTFAPEAKELRVDVDGRGARRVTASDLAYVAFHRGPNEPAITLGPDVLSYKIHLIGGRTVPVLARSEVDAKAPGFRAIPTSDAGAIREFYFFSRAVRARERDERLGAMLVREGALQPDALERAIAAQRANQNTPIGKLLAETLGVSEAEIAPRLNQQQPGQNNVDIGDFLIEEGLATREQIAEAVAEQQRRKSKRIGEVLLDLRIVDERELTRMLARKFDLRFVDLDAEPPNPEAAREIPKELIAKYRILPIEKSAKALVVAISDPLALEGIDEVRFVAEQRVEEVLATRSALEQRIEQFLGAAPKRGGTTNSDIELVLKRLNETPGAAVDERDDVTGLEDPTDSAVVELVNRIIADAHRRGASDIHIEPNGRERDMLIRFRIDGDCVEVQQIPARHRSAVVARIKILAQLDIAERRKPQDGKIRFRLPDGQIELRVASIPTVNGNEDVVLRVLAASKPIPLESLELSPRNFTEVDAVIHKPYGLVLCVGPTGSGKTTTLHSLLSRINTPDTKIWTAEDPVEITQQGLRQVQVNARIGFTFAQAMRAFLRADPDVIMVGEMRDHETASTGIEASLTGHLVLSTLHTNSAPETVIRLLDMGLDPFNFADALLGVLAQRLARRICRRCRVQTAASASESKALRRAYGEAEFAQDFPAWAARDPVLTSGRGCDACGGAGYKGRIGVHELLVANDDIKTAILRRAPITELRKLAREQGMRTLVQDGIEKALRGETNLKQVLAVCA